MMSDISPSSSSKGDLRPGKDTARWYYNLGMNILPIKKGSKIPPVSWERWETTRQEWGDIAHFDWQYGIAAINGVGIWHSLDIDKAPSYRIVNQVLDLLGLPVSYPWIVRTGKGFHLWFQGDGTFTLRETAKGCYVGRALPEYQGLFERLEIRWQRCITILPPTIHPEGRPYEWARGVLPTSEHLARIDAPRIQDAFLSLAELLSEKREEPPPAQQPALPISIYSPWAKKAFRSEIHRLQGAQEGERNIQLNRSAFALGGLIAGGSLAEDDVISALTEAALSSGLTPQEVAATIKSGITDGKQFPRSPKTKDLEEQQAEGEDSPDLTSFSPDDAGNGEAMYALYGKAFLFNKTHGWLKWTGTHWQEDDVVVDTAAVETLRQRRIAAVTEENEAILKVTKANTDRINGCRTLFRTHVYEPIECFDLDPDLLNVLNGVLDLRTGELLPHHPRQRFTYVVPLEWDPHASFSLWEDFVASAVGGDSAMVTYLQQALGYSFTGHTREEKMFCVVGPTRAGKGTWSETILGTLSGPLAMEVDFNTFTARREGDTNNFDLAQMKSSRLVFASESNKYQSLNPGKIKLLTGGNQVRAAYKHKDSFTYRPQYKIWLISNHEVNADPDDDALWGRVQVISFPHSHLGSEDKRLKERMRRAGILQGVLRWAVAGSIQWYMNGGLTPPESVRLETRRHRDQLDTVAQWLGECCEVEQHTVDGGAWTSNTALTDSYSVWCKNNHLEPRSQRMLLSSLKAKGFETNVQSKNEGRNKKGVAGIVLR